MRNANLKALHDLALNAIEAERKGKSPSKIHDEMTRIAVPALFAIVDDVLHNISRIADAQERKAVAAERVAKAKEAGVGKWD